MGTKPENVLLTDASNAQMRELWGFPLNFIALRPKIRVYESSAFICVYLRFKSS